VSLNFINFKHIIIKQTPIQHHYILLTLIFYRMSRAMFEYTKTVLKKVSFDTTLFCKEVQKALQRLLPYEIEELKLFIQNLVISNPDLKQCMVYLN